MTKSVKEQSKMEKVKVRSAGESHATVKARQSQSVEDGDRRWRWSKNGQSQTKSRMDVRQNWTKMPKIATESERRLINHPGYHNMHHFILQNLT